MAAHMICTQDTVLHCCLLIVPLIPMWLGVHLCVHIAGLRNHQEVQVASRSRLPLAISQWARATWIDSYVICICVVAAYFAILKFITTSLFCPKQTSCVSMSSVKFVSFYQTYHWFALSYTLLLVSIDGCDFKTNWINVMLMLMSGTNIDIDVDFTVGHSSAYAVSYTHLTLPTIYSV